jgi:CxxC-x17-CxxC domain-containing protein
MKISWQSRILPMLDSFAGRPTGRDYAAGSFPRSWSPCRLALTEPPSPRTGVSVTYADKTLSCRDCGQAFVFTSGEQEFHAMKGFNNEPSRCPDCRAARKASRGDVGGYSGGGYTSGGYSTGYGRPERQMYTAVCSDCGGEARVPFQPRGDKPVYCSDCFSRQRGGYR